MIDWGTFLTGSATGGLIGALTISLTANLAQEVLGEWRDGRADTREREQERRAEARAVRDATRAAVLPALDAVFDAADTVIREVEEIRPAIEHDDRFHSASFGSADPFFSAPLAAAIHQIQQNVLIVRREIEANALVTIAQDVIDAYHQFTQETPQYGDRHWVNQRLFLAGLVEEMLDGSRDLQDIVLLEKDALDVPL